MNNSMENQTNISDLDSIFILRVLPSLYCLIFVVGLPLNCMAAWMFFRVAAESGLVVYLQNMMLADLLMLITIPLRVADTLGLKNKDVFIITCRYANMLFFTCLLTGILFVCFISLERYVKIVHPSSSASCTSRFSVLSLLRYLEKTRHAWVVVAISWVVVLSIVLPNVVMTSLAPTGQTFQDCMELKTPMGVIWHTRVILFDASLFWVTLVIVTFCYGSIGVEVYRSQTGMCQDSTGACNRSSRSIFSILVMFFICFVPYHVCHVKCSLSQIQGSNDGCHDSLILHHLKEVSLFLSALTVCLNPVVYLLMCPKFQETLRRKLSERRRRRSQTVLSAQTPSNT
ncbi:P2Y purinoceptor 14 [Oryzias melastigma]|uniref:P2Y purinoceptor 14 n=1 Tax=Oryzias melastigma TaxID=30732 RepID=UPI000CF7EB06|nr:P2Y purinoceptor 14 [Oryzias melastigma]